MEPVTFPEQNKMLAGGSVSLVWPHESGGSLPIFTDGKVCVSCWKMSWKERLRALFGGKAWLLVMSGEAQPPISLNVEKTALERSARTRLVDSL